MTSSHAPYTVAMTGGLASGKSAVTTFLRQLGVDVIDADHAAHQLLLPDTPTFIEVHKRYGAHFLNADGQLNRSKLRRYIFNHPQEKKWLEQLMHPKIAAMMLEAREQCEGPYCVLCIPLLAETQRPYPHQRVWVIDSPYHLQKERAQKRDGMTPEEIDTILASQASRTQRLSLAHEIIDNSGSLQELEHATGCLHERTLRLASYQA